MKTKTIIITILLSVSTAVYSQDFDTQEYNEEDSVSTEIVKNKKWQSIIIGYRGGLSVSRLLYTSDTYDFYERKSTSGLINGLFMIVPLSKNFSFRPEVSFVERGGRMNFQWIDYKLKATYLDIRLPIACRFNAKGNLNPYITAAPSFNLVSWGHIDYNNYSSTSTEAFSIKLNKDNIRRFDVGVFLGAGMDYLAKVKEKHIFIGGQIGYSLGLMNTFSAKEKDATILNNPHDPIVGKRRNGNLEVSVSIGFPLSNFSKRKDDIEPEVFEEPVVVKDTVDVPPQDDKNTLKIEEKDCYSIDEMIAFVTLHVDISAKRVCDLDNLHFDYGKATLHNSFNGYLNKLVQLLKSAPEMEIGIYGHTDDKGGDKFNMKLSMKRAMAVADYLKSNGIDESRLHCNGFGATQPVESNETEYGCARNRRVEIEILNVN